MKTLLAIILFLFLVIDICPPRDGSYVRAEEFVYTLDDDNRLEVTPKTGTAGDSYPGTAQVEFSRGNRFGTKTFVIYNSHATLNLTYSVKVRYVAGGLFFPYPDPDGGVLEDEVLGAQEFALISVTEQCNKIDFFFKNTVGGQSPTFRVELSAREGF